VDSRATERNRTPELDHEPIDARSYAIFAWRLEELGRAGYSADHAFALAEDSRVDLHDACRLLQRGCPEHTAYLILS
jgi:hypothetical protein